MQRNDLYGVIEIVVFERVFWDHVFVCVFLADISIGLNSHDGKNGMVLDIIRHGRSWITDFTSFVCWLKL